MCHESTHVSPEVNSTLESMRNIFLAYTFVCETLNCTLIHDYSHVSLFSFSFSTLDRIMNSLQNCYAISITLVASLTGRLSILQVLFTLIVYIASNTLYLAYAVKIDVFEATTGKFYHNLLFASFFTTGGVIVTNRHVIKSGHIVSTCNINCITTTASSTSHPTAVTTTCSSSTRRCDDSLGNLSNQLILLISIVLLFTFYPSVLSSGIFGDKKHRIILNTILALSSSAVTGFSLASLVDPSNRFNVVS